MEEGHCCREVSSSAADAILTHSTWSNAQECQAQLQTCWLTAAVQVRMYTLFFLSVRVASRCGHWVWSLGRVLNDMISGQCVFKA